MIDDKKKGQAWNWTYKKHKILTTNDTKYRITSRGIFDAGRVPWPIEKLCQTAEIEPTKTLAIAHRRGKNYGKVTKGLAQHIFNFISNTVSVCLLD